MSGEAFHTSEAIGAALGISGRAVRMRLASIASSAKAERGQLAKAWTFAEMPEDWRAKLLKRASDYGFRDVSHLLNAEVDLWQPRIALADCEQSFLDKADKLRTALARTIARIAEEMPIGEFRRRGVADYQAAFGFPISEKQWQRLLDRTLARAGSSGDFGRLEIYLGDNARAKVAPATVAAAQLRADHAELAGLIRSFATPMQPTAAEKCLLWQHAFERCEELIAAGIKDKAARREVVQFLFIHAPYLAKSREALQELFKDKRDRWIAGGRVPAAIEDKRAEAGAARRRLMPPEDKQTALAFAVKFGGGISQGFREARKAGALSLETAMRTIENPADKSHVPRAIRNELKYDAALLQDHMRGPRKAKLGGAYIERDPTAYNAGDWQQGDDVTLPNYYWEDTPEGVRLMRGQVLAMIDVRSTYILGFVLISAGQNTGSHYNAWHIRNLITEVHDCYGLPRKGFAFENGSWRAKILTGNAAPTAETEKGLRAFGVRFTHARLPRGKVIERVFGSIQNYLEAEPGYCGRNEVADKYERLRKHIQLVEAGHEHPAKYFLNRDQWAQRLSEIFDKYNNEPQGGKYLPGISPKEGYETYFGNEPVVRLPASARHLLANEVKRVRIGSNGITFLDRRQRFTYKSPETGALQGREVEAFFNYEHPEILGVRDPQSGKVFSVARSTMVPGMDAPAELIAQAEGENAAHNGYARALYRSLVPKFSEYFMRRPHFRQTMVDAATAATAEQLATSEAEVRAGVTQGRKNKRRATAAAQRIGMAVPETVSETRAEAIEKFAKLMEEED